MSVKDISAGNENWDLLAAYSREMGGGQVGCENTAVLQRQGSKSTSHPWYFICRPDTVDPRGIRRRAMRAQTFVATALAATLVVLTLASFVSAERAWLLQVNGKARIASFATLNECMDEAKRNIMKVPAVPGHKPESTESSWSVLAPLLVGGASELRYDCVPDTVDSRVPNGSRR